MIAFLSNNAASEPTAVFARFGEGASGHFLQSRYASGSILDGDIWARKSAL